MEAQLGLHVKIKLSTRAGEVINYPIRIAKMRWPRDRPEGSDGEGTGGD